MRRLRPIGELLDIGVEGGPTDPHQDADLFRGVFARFVEFDGMGALAWVEELAPPAFATASPRSGKSSLRALPDQGPFELGQSPEQMENELSAARRRVDRLLKGSQPDALLLQFLGT